MSVTTQAELAAVQAAEQSQYLTFLLDGEMFAIGILAIKEIIEFNKLTTVPMMPRFVRGVINLRGAVVPVVDLSARFGRAGTTASRRTCIVIVEIDTGEGRQVVGVLVDSVSEVLDIPATEIEPAPSFGARVRTEFIAGMGKVKGKFVIILSVAHVLSAEEMDVLAEAGAKAEETVSA
jgi:purine-binding chemotaxis protein CheW